MYQLPVSYADSSPVTVCEGTTPPAILPRPEGFQQQPASPECFSPWGAWQDNHKGVDNTG